MNLSTTAGTISPAVSAVFASGVRTESVSVTQAGTGKTITATRTGGSETGTSNSFTVNPGAPAAVTLAGAATDLTSGSSRSYTATVKDANGNVATNFGGSVTFSQTTGSGSLTGLGSVNAVSGVATISLTGNAAGSVTIKATASSIDSNTLTFNVIAGALNKFAIANISSPQTAGSAFGITITAQDANSNTVPSFTNTVNLSTTAGAITPTVSGAFAAGVRTENVTVTQAGLGKTITATRTGGGETGTSNTFDVNAGALAKFAISTISDPQTAGTAFGITITAQDANSNTVPSFTNTVNLRDRKSVV